MEPKEICMKRISFSVRDPQVQPSSAGFAVGPLNPSMKDEAATKKMREEKISAMR